LLDTVEVEEELLQAAYDERIAEFVQPERRLVERLIFPDQAAAEAAAARIADGGTFEAEVDARGLQLADTDLGDVLPADLDGAADAVFAAEAPEVVGPLETSLGPALFRVNAVLPARETTFEEARDDLQDDLALDRARRVIAQMIDEADNELAGGATLEEVVEVTDLELGTLDWFPGVEADITGYEAFRTAAAEVTESDFPEMAALDDGGIFALRLDETIPPALRPFEDVRPALEEAWTRQATTEALVTLAQTLEPQIAGGMDMATLGLTAQEESDLPRTAFVPDAPADFLIEVFDMAPGETLIIPGDGRVALVRLDAVNAADLNDPDTAALANAVTAQVGQDYALDLYQVFSQGVVDKTSITLDQA
ncbi:MAG: peptidyl-prolyl cis-trans isomerase, partial [Pseudomonadota bacterium]